MLIPIDDYDYPLPDERIARFPLERREESKLLVFKDGKITQSQFKNIGDFLPAGALLVANNARVIRARLVMHKPTGARIELFCLEPAEPADYERAFAATGNCTWHCMVGNSKKWKEGALEVAFEEGTLRAERGEGDVIRFSWDAPLAFGQVLEILGRMPIPPYLGRDSQEIDNTRYQTVYSKIEGSVAAPTAGLHFSDGVLDELRGRGFRFGEVTLHVGAGTFLPVKSADASQHPMHTEHFSVSAEMVAELAASAGNIVAVGTTSVRCLESLTVLGHRILNSGDPELERAVGQWEWRDVPSQADAAELLSALAGYMERNGMRTLTASTRIMIAPVGYKFRVVNGLITNFHQPQSTLLLLVSAFTRGRWRDIYDYALGNGFRFLSYGDSSLLL